MQVRVPRSKIAVNFKMVTEESTPGALLSVDPVPLPGSKAHEVGPGSIPGTMSSIPNTGRVPCLGSLQTEVTISKAGKPGEVSGGLLGAWVGFNKIGRKKRCFSCFLECYYIISVLEVVIRYLLELD